MPDRAEDGIIFIRDGTSLPPILSVTTDAFMPNWRIVTSHNRSTLVRSIEECDWYFFLSGRRYSGDRSRRQYTRSSPQGAKSHSNQTR